MKKSNFKEENNFKSHFLDKFAGKLNVVTKHGEIQDQTTIKLPLIKNNHTHRSSTCVFRSSKQSLMSCSSEIGRNSFSKSAISNNRASKYLTKDSRQLTDISNSFLKKSYNKGLKVSRLKHHTLEPMSALTFSQKTHEEKKKQNDLLAHSQTQKGYSDYQKFLNELNLVSSVVKNKKVAS